MDKQKVITTLLIVLCVITVIILILVAATYLFDVFRKREPTNTIGYSSETVQARVLNIQEEGTTTVGKNEQSYQIVEIEILEGELIHRHLFLEFGKNQIMPKEYLLEQGQKILVTTVENQMEGKPNAYFVDFVRGHILIWLFLAFALVAFLIGSWTGLRSLMGIILSIAVILLFIIPQIAKGENPVFISIIGSAVFLSVSLYVVYGWKPMTHCAVLSMIIALIITGIISIVATTAARLTGFGNENAMFLIQQSEVPIDMRGILLAGIIIGSLGVLDDLVVGQSSAVFQLHRANPAMSFSDLARSATTIGRDHAAASVNTLVLAYAGEALPMLLLFSITRVNLSMAVNISFIAEEIVRALAGTIGLFLSIPIATWTACLWVKYKKKNFQKR